MAENTNWDEYQRRNAAQGNADLQAALAATKEELRLAHSTIRVGMEVIQRLLDDPDGEYERASARAWVREGEEYYARRDQPAASEGGE